MERVGGRQEKMEGLCSTGESPQWAVVPMEEEEEGGGGEEEEEILDPDLNSKTACSINPLRPVNTTVCDKETFHLCLVLPTPCLKYAIN